MTCPLGEGASGWEQSQPSGQSRGWQRLGPGPASPYGRKAQRIRRCIHNALSRGAWVPLWGPPAALPSTRGDVDVLQSFAWAAERSSRQVMSKGLRPQRAATHVPTDASERAGRTPSSADKANCNKSLYAECIKETSENSPERLSLSKGSRKKLEGRCLCCFMATR